MAVAAALLAAAVGNLTQLFLVQAQTGSLVWVLVGVAVTMRSGHPGEGDVDSRVEGPGSSPAHASTRS